MFLVRTLGYPAIGKEAEYRTLVVEFAKKIQAKGTEVSLSRQLFAPERTTLVAAFKFRDLADFEKFLGQSQTDPDFQALAAKLAPLSRESLRTELFEVLVPFAK